MDARTYLEQHCLRSREDIAAFIKADYHQTYDSQGHGWTYSADLGWILVDSVRPDGIDGSNTFYHYEASGCRRRIHAPEQQARIHTYGNSFTHCDQVSDGETWQEYLAAHLREPIENYGVGGYSVYQAYRRMLATEKDHPAPYIVLNIWDDDNYRNLDAWRTLRFGRGSKCGFTLPHLAVDLASGQVSERDNLCPTPKSLYRLADLDWLVETFADDPVLRVVLDSRTEDTQPIPSAVPITFGLPLGQGDQSLRRAHTQAALQATRHVLQLTETFVQQHDKNLLVVLSHSSGGIRRALAGEEPWDQALLDYLQTRPYPVVDLRDHHRAEFARFQLGVDDYVKRYYNGHYSPAGNFFFAQALKEVLVDWLNPKPAPYRPYAQVVQGT
ncbi:MAG: hypothetical protein GKR89_01220 [Candidatus Latescibacteria bacterium]|nr:hypothetical protein [Candidatus Latescibacterota bacterium]